MITFLAQCEMLLKLDGVLSLVIPDKRYCSDNFNASSSAGKHLDAFVQKRKRPSPGNVLDHFVGATKRNENITLDKGAAGKIVLTYSSDEARAYWDTATTMEDYIDVHNWRFAPNSFRLKLIDLQSPGLTGLSLAKEHDTEGCEFYVALRKTTASTFPDRLELLNKARVDG
jgi:hypothetical protein